MSAKDPKHATRSRVKSAVELAQERKPLFPRQNGGRESAHKETGWVSTTWNILHTAEARVAPKKISWIRFIIHYLARYIRQIDGYVHACGQSSWGRVRC